MIRRPALKATIMSRAFGHAVGVLGAVMGLNAIATSIDPHYLHLTSFRSATRASSRPRRR
jgi:hypothetical protein